MKPLTVFIHIPRTGGTSLIRTLESHFQNHARWYHENPPFPDYREGLEFIHGHFNLDMIERIQMEHGLFPGREARYITLLRNPAERTLSYYYYSKGHERNISFEEWLQEKDDAARRINAHVRQLASTNNPTERDIDIAIEQLTGKNVIYGRVDCYSYCVPKMLAAIGIEESVTDYDRDLVHRNKNENYPESFPPGYITLAEKYNELDIEFWGRLKDGR